MEDAKGKKMKWKERLRETAIESRWIMRESLVIKGAAFTMVLEDNKSNAAESTKLVSGGWESEGVREWGVESTKFVVFRAANFLTT